MSAPAGKSVLVVLHGETLGGASTSVLLVVPELEALGWRFVFWCARPSSLFDEVRRRGHEVSGEPLPFLGYSRRALGIAPGARRRLARAPRYFRGLARTIAATSPDVVHLNSLYTMAEAAVVRAQRRPALLHVHEMVPAGGKGRVARGLAHALATRVAGVSAASAAALSAPGRPALVIHEGVADEGVARRTSAPETVVGTIGVISPRKGTDLFVEAAQLVSAQAGDVRFRIAGGAENPLDREFAAALLARLDGLGIAHAERVDTRAELEALDVLVMPSRADPFPLVVLEAMAAGVAVIGAAVDGIAEQLAGGAGVLVPAEDPGALARAILELHASPERRASIGAAGREHALAEFSLERQAASLDRAYRAAIG